VIGRIVRRTLEKMNPQFPSPEEDLDGITFE
jgi:hypothetical protein